MLRLIKIELSGFKSFALPTAIETDNDILGLVGPNGAGKSNILDAVHFAFGEQKPTMLRVGRVSDIIFGGAKSHPRQNLARVQLTFEYFEKDDEEPQPAEELQLITLPEEDETVDYASRPYGSEVGELEPEPETGPAPDDEIGVAGLDKLQPGDVITLARKAYRDGLSEYSLNGKSVRLSTVDRFFSRFQLGRYAAFSINQGEVEKKLLASPREIREWLGEASGVALLLRAKETVARRLLRSRRNLTRISDILLTLRDDVKALGEQAEDTERHNYLEQQRRWLAGYLARGRLLSAATKAEKIRAERTSHAQRLAKLETGIAALRAELEQAEREAAELLQRERGMIDQLNAQRDALSRQRIAESVLEGKKRSLTSRRDEDAGRLAIIEKRTGELAGRFEYLQEKVKRSAGALKESGETLRSAEELLLREENSIAWLKDELASADKKRVELQQELAVTREKLAHAHHERTHTERKLAEVEKNREARASELARLKSDSDQLSLDFEKKEERLVAEERRLAEARKRYEEVTDALRAAEKQLASVNERSGYMAAMKNTYEELKSEFYTSDGDDTAAPSLTLTPLLDLVSFDEEWADAVELALGDVARALVLADDGGESIIDERSLHGIFIAPGTAASASADTPWVSLWSQLHGGGGVIAALRSSLGEIAVVESAGEANKLLAENPALAGCIIRPALTLVTRGVIRKPGAPKTSLLFRRHAEMPRVDEEVVELAARRAQLQKRVQELEAERDRWASESVRWDKAVRNLQMMSLDLRGKLSEAVSREEGIATERERIAEEHRSLTARRDELAAQERELDTRADELTAKLEKISAETARSSESLQSTEQALEERRKEIRELEKARMKLATEHEVAETQFASLTRERENLEAEHDRLSAEMESAAAQLKTITVEQKELALELKKTEKLIARLEKDAGKRAEEQSGLTGRRERITAEIQSLTENRQKLEASSGDYQERLWEAESEVSEIIREIHGNLGISIITMMHELARDAVRPAVQPADYFPRFAAGESPAVTGDSAQESAPLLDYHKLSEKQIREELGKIERALSNLGEVNPLAPRDFSEKNERLQFLTQQEQDLKLAIEDMKQMLENLDRQTRDRFARSLKLIEGKFNELFTRLFGGGFARFKLTEPDDLIESGVEIEVQLPNARRQNIKALSGGERSLLFIALFIAVHMVRTGSFCVLDEVDASLDDVNIVRLCQMLEDLSQREQFLVITHNKRTMKVMQRLIGVVTQPRGISRVIEVSLKQAERYADKGAA